MNPQLIDQIFLIAAILFMGGAFVVLFTHPLLMLFFPKKLVDKVICPPYFNEHDAQTLNYFPYSIMRTNIIIGSLSLPFYNRRYKGLGIATKQHAPSWFLALAYVTFWLGILPGAIGFLLIIIFSFFANH